MLVQLRTAWCVPSSGASGDAAGIGGPSDPHGAGSFPHATAQCRGVAPLRRALPARRLVPALRPRA